MVFVPATDTVKVDFFQTWASQQVCNTVYYHLDTPWDEAAMNALGSDLVAWLNSDWKDAITSNCSFHTIKITDLTTQNSPGIEYTTGLPIAGTNAIASVPNNVSVVYKWITGYRGRSYRGRWYVAGLQQVHVNNNTVDGAYITSMTTALNKLHNTIPTTGMTMVICSRYHNKAPRALAVCTEVVGGNMNATVDSQRRRLPERGR